MDYIHVSFWLLLVVTFVLAWVARPRKDEKSPPGFKAFSASFLIAWFLCVSADWLQGPYTYSLYEGFGFPKKDIARLYVVAAVSGGIFGTGIGYVADKYGRKRMCLAYCVVYGIGCLTKHFNSYKVLFFGRCLDGLATSILHTCFESWMVSQHTGKYKFSAHLLSFMFKLMYTIMFISAILAGIVGHLSDATVFRLSPVATLPQLNMGGDITPFDIAFACLALGFTVIALTWEENYGDSNADIDMEQDSEEEDPNTSSDESVEMVLPGSAPFSWRRITLLAVIVAFFEAAMCVFVFQWSDVLSEKNGEKIPHGLIFTTLMMASMCGSSVSEMIDDALGPKRQLTLVLWVSMLAFTLTSYFITRETQVGCFLCFLVFEVCVGVYFPAVGNLKSRIVPEHVRSTVYNIYRIPLNLMEVILVLVEIPLSWCFALCAVILGIALVCNVCLGQLKKC